VKTFISEEDFQRVTELLGLPGETLRFAVGPRVEPFTGVDSSWQLEATIAVPGVYEDHENVEPYEVRVVYVPVLLPGDRERNETRRRELERLWQAGSKHVKRQ
jgi:hypothetical protein